MNMKFIDKAEDFKLKINKRSYISMQFKKFLYESNKKRMEVIKNGYVSKKRNEKI